MGSTNKTAHYELPQFVANDKPSWLGDVNEAMEAIDTGIYGAKSSADGAQQTANNAVAGVQSAGTRMDGIQTQLDTVATQANQTATTVAGHTSSIATNSANINTLNSRMGSTDISGIGDGTVTGAIDALAQGGGAGTITTLAEVDCVTTVPVTPATIQLSDSIDNYSRVLIASKVVSTGILLGVEELSVVAFKNIAGFSSVYTDNAIMTHAEYADATHIKGYALATQTGYSKLVVYGIK